MESLKNIFTLTHMIEQITNENIVRFTNEFSYPIGISTIVILREIKISGPIKQVNLSETLGYSKSTITNVANKLVQLELIERMYEESDRRTVHLKITEKGIEALNEAKSIGDKIYTELYSCLSDEELSQFINIQKKLIDGFKGKWRLSP